MRRLVLVPQLFDSFVHGTLLYFRFFVSVGEFFELYKWDEEFEFLNLERLISYLKRTGTSTVDVLALQSGDADGTAQLPSPSLRFVLAAV